MMSKLFWLTVTLLLAAAVHLAYVLFMPVTVMREEVASLKRNQALNAFRVLDGANSELISRGVPQDLVQAVCVYDISAKPVHVDASFPEDYWSLAVYSSTGKNLYTVNDRQAGANNVSLLIRAPQKLTADEETVPAAADAIDVESQENEGIVILSALAPAVALREKAAAILASSRCSAS